MRDGGRIVSVAAIIAMAVSSDGRREIIGLGIGPSEAEPFWSAFLKGLVKRGLKGIKLVISDAHDGLRLAITRVLGATWQRCRVGLLKIRRLYDSVLNELRYHSYGAARCWGRRIGTSRNCLSLDRYARFFPTITF